MSTCRIGVAAGAMPGPLMKVPWLHCRAAQPEVLEWLWYLNSHANYVYPRTGGDKDTYKLAFHLAGRPDDFRQVATKALGCPLVACVPFTLSGLVSALNLSTSQDGSEGL